MDIIGKIHHHEPGPNFWSCYFHDGHRFSCHVGISSGEAKLSPGRSGCTIAVDSNEVDCASSS
jgi:hypothetical protein